MVCCLQLFLCVTLQGMMRERISSPSDAFSFKSSPRSGAHFEYATKRIIDTTEAIRVFRLAVFPSWCLRAVAVTCCVEHNASQLAWRVLRVCDWWVS